MFENVGNKFKIIYGRDLLKKLVSNLNNYLIVTDQFLYNKYKEEFLNEHDAYLIKDIEEATLVKDINNYRHVDGVLGFGGGMAIDCGKWIAENLNVPIYSFPTVLSVNAAFCYKAAIRRDDVVKYVGRIFPEAIYIDFDIIKEAPKYLNISGAADLLSCITASYDWKINSLITASHKFSHSIYEGAQYLVAMLAENIDNIKEVNDAGIYFMCEAYLWIAENSAIMNHTMWESASEHVFAENMEYICKKPFNHGQIIGLGVYFMSLLQNNQHARVVSMLKRLGIDITLDALSITEAQLRECLLTLKDFAVKQDLRYTIINAKEMDSAWVNMAISKYKKDFLIN